MILEGFNVKKLFSLLLAFCVLINIFCISAYASDDLVVEFYKSEYIDYSESQCFSSGFASLYYYKNTEGKQIYSSYSMLSKLEREYYDTIVNLPIGTLSFQITYSPNLTAEEFASIDFTKIMNAICLDHPEIFYYNGYSCGRSYYPSTGAVASVTYNIVPKKHGQTNVAIYSSSNIHEYYEALKTAFESVEVNTSNRYNFVKDVHDYLCNNVTYVNDYASCHDVYGTLVNKEAVCQGYAETMKMFCNYYKIPCVCITGTAGGGGHMWNAIQMDDGKWYLLDITWDDQDAYGIYTDFFLVGLNTSDIYFTGNPFSTSHVSDGSAYLPVLDYATEKYTETEHNTAFKATYNSISKDKGKYLIRSFFDAKDTLVYYNGMYIESENITTGQTFEVPSGNNGIDEYWTMVLIGDCNGDGSCDALDYSNAVNKVLADTEVVTAYDRAADADCDGYLDVVDLSIIERAVSGSNTNIILE